MPRPKEFDVDQVLQRALEVFWKQGYEATSMQDLVRAMGIRRASLYGTFGDKHSLFLRALQSYQQRSLAAMTAALGDGSPLGAIRALLTATADQAASRAGKQGCLCVNTSIELAPHDPKIAANLQAHGERVRELLAATLRRAVAGRELPKQADVDGLATLVFGVLVSLSVLGKMRLDAAQLRGLVAHALHALAA